MKARAVFSGACAALAFCLPTPAAAQTAPQPRIEFTLYNTHTELRSLAGQLLPLAPALGWQRHGLNARTYSEQSMVADDRQDAPRDAAIRVLVADGPGYAQLTVDQIMGDMHALAGFTGPSPEWATSDFSYSSNVVLTLPARSVLTITGNIDVQADAGRYQNYAYFQQVLTAVVDGTTGDRFTFHSAAPTAGFSISAVNPLDVEATFHYYSSLGGLAFTVIAVPEPSSAMMAAAGVLLMCAMLRRQHRVAERARCKARSTASTTPDR
jgi:hypothetical protein